MSKYMPYYEQLRRPEWQRRRLEVLQSKDFCCAMCGDSESELHVHHRIYEKGRKAWEYSNEELTVLCEHCHSLWHNNRTALLKNILLATYDGDTDDLALAAICSAYLHVNQPPFKGNEFSAEFIAEMEHDSHLSELYQVTRKFFEKQKEKRMAAYRKKLKAMK